MFSVVPQFLRPALCFSGERGRGEDTKNDYGSCMTSSNRADWRCHELCTQRRAVVVDPLMAVEIVKPADSQHPQKTSHRPADTNDVLVIGVFQIQLSRL